MVKKEKYECLVCKRTATVESGEEAPMCCGEPMKKMSREICLQPAHAEHARPMERDEPCDEM